MTGKPDLRTIFRKTDDDTFVSALPVAQKDKDAFFTLLARHGINPNASTRAREVTDASRPDMDMQAAFINSNGRIVCDSSVVKKLEQAGVKLNIRALERTHV